MICHVVDARKGMAVDNDLGEVFGTRALNLGHPQDTTAEAMEIVPNNGYVVWETEKSDDRRSA